MNYLIININNYLIVISKIKCISKWPPFGNRSDFFFKFGKHFNGHEPNSKIRQRFHVS